MARAYFIVLTASMLTVGCAGKVVRFEIENDSIAKSGDANYTNGLQINVSPSGQSYRGQNVWLNRLNVIDSRTKSEIEDDIEEDEAHDGFKNRPIWLDFKFGQVFYTPDDVTLTNLTDIDKNGRELILDRPFAGFLFGGVDIHNLELGGSDLADWTGDQRRTVSWRLGITGSASLSEDAQSYYHNDVCDCGGDPVGWVNQVGSELGLIVSVEQQNRLWHRYKKDVIQELPVVADFSSLVKGSIGNIFTGLEVGGIFRIGLNPPRAALEDTITDVVGGDQKNKYSLYVFSRLSARTVFRDFSLDGRLFSSDIHTIEPEVLVLEGQLGISAEIWKVGFSASLARRTNQFVTQRGPHTFGTVDLSYSF